MVVIEGLGTRLPAVLKSVSIAATENERKKKKKFHIKGVWFKPFFFGVCIFEVLSHQKARAGWLIYFLILYNCTRTITSNTIVVGSGHAWDKARVNRKLNTLIFVTSGKRAFNSNPNTSLVPRPGYIRIRNYCEYELNLLPWLNLNVFLLQLTYCDNLPRCFMGPLC